MTEKKSSIIIIHVIATTLAISVHATSKYLGDFTTNTFDWNYANLINSFSRCSVPIFIMLSGAAILGKEQKMSDFYKNDLMALVYPFLFWTVMYLGYDLFKLPNLGELSTNEILKFSVDKILHGASPHLWYMYMIIGVYVAVPFIRLFIKQLSIKQIEFFLLFWLISMILTNPKFYGFVPKFDLTFFSGYAGYLVLGYYIRIKEFKFSAFTALGIFVAMGIFTTLMTYYLSHDENKFDNTFYSYLVPNTPIASGALFLWSKKTFENTPNANIPKWIRTIEQYCFGIFLVHIFPLDFVRPLVFKYFNTLITIPLTTILTMALGFVVIYLLRKIPYGNKVSG